MIDPILDDGFSLRCKHTFWMELYATDVERLVAHGHNLTFFADCSHFKTVWQTMLIHHPRMISSHLNRVLQTFKDIIVAHQLHLGGNTVKHFVEIGQTAAKMLTDGLMTKADPKNGFLASISLDDIKKQARLFGYTGSWREQDFVVT